MEKVSFQGQTLTRWRAGNSTFLAHPEKGARLMNWNIQLGDGSIRDVLFWPENANFDDIAKVRGGNPLLFPFNGRSFDQGEIFFWRGEDGVRRAMPLHGIARQGEFKVTRLDVRGFEATFVPGDEARACYPFDYELVVTYRFEPLGLSCDMALTNLGKVRLPWCAGHHFYFTVPWGEGMKRSDYLIRIPATKRLKQDPSGALIPGPELKAVESLGNPAIIDVFHSGLTGREAVFGEPNRPGDIVVRLGTQDVPPPEACFVTWTLAEDSPFFCVEPWMGPANAPGHRVGLNWVAPGETQKFGVSVSVR